MPETKSWKDVKDQVEPSDDNLVGLSTFCDEEVQKIGNEFVVAGDKELGERKECKVVEEQLKQYKYPALEGGWGWVVVFVGATIHILTRGILFSTGVLFSEWISCFGKPKSDTAWIGSIATGSALLLGPVTSHFIEKWGYRVTGMVGGFISTMGFLISHWATGIQFLYVSYGIIAGTGLGITYLSGVIAVGEYFEERRSLAFGIAASGAGCGTAVMAMLQQYLLNEYGWQGTMLILAGVSGLNQIVCGALLRPLASPINWRSRRSCLRLLQRRRVCIEQALYTRSSVENIYEKLDCNIKGTSTSIYESKGSICTDSSVPNLVEKPVSNSSKDSGFTDSDQQETVLDNAEDSKDLISGENDSNSNLNPHFSPNRRAVPGASASSHFAMSPSLLLRRKILKTQRHDDRRSHGCSIYTSPNHLNPFESTSDSPPYTSLRSLREVALGNPYTEVISASRSKSNSRLRAGDAFYLSSLSIASSKAVLDEQYFDSTSRGHPAVMTEDHDAAKSYYSADISEQDVIEENCQKDGQAIINEDSTRYQRVFPPILRNPLFLIMAFNQFFTGLGVLVPFVHLTEKAILMGMGETRAALLVSVIGIGNIIGKVVLGQMCDMKCFNIFVVFLLSQIGLAFSVLLTPFFMSFEAMVLFSFVFGFCYGNYSAIPSMMAEYVGLRNLAQAMGYITFLEGASAIIGPPLAGHIYDVTLSYNVAFGVAGLFLLFSCMMLLPQPLFYERITGNKSHIRKYFELVFPILRKKTENAVFIGTYEDEKDTIVGSKMSDINANYPK